ncbi:MAG: co-chaperone GroES [Candidatus Kerfeldbacteria bacterium]|nr:co-chaperone GroES [Candidatus Kerfeldbacteria bacterium]
MNLQPVGDRVLVRPLTEQEVTASGIVLPDTVDREKKAEGEVLAVGDGEDVKKLNLTVGATVLFGKYAGDDIEYNDEDLKFLKHDEILAVVKK